METNFNITLGSMIFDYIDAALRGTLANGTAKVMLALAALYGTLWVLQLTARSLVWIWQGMTVAMQDLIFSVIKMAAIVSCAFNVDWYMSVVVPFVGDFPAWVGAKLMSTAGTQINSVDALVSAFLNAVVSLLESMKFSFSIEMIQGIVSLVFLVMGGAPFMAVTVGTLIVLKVATTLLLVVGPMFIAFLLFDSTRQWFWSWVSTMGGFMLTQIFFSVVVALQISFINTNIISDGKIKTDWVGAIAILVVFNAFTLISTALPNIAASVMGGGAAPTSGMGGLMGRTLGAATGISAARKMAAMFAVSRLLNRNKIS
ncbi:TrbL/VirB6 plasmid conjugal transfer protein [compost metagenome]